CGRDESIPRLESHFTRLAVPHLLDGTRGEWGPRAHAGRASARVTPSEPRRTSQNPVEPRRTQCQRLCRMITRMTPSAPSTRSSTMSEVAAVTVPDVATGDAA